MLLENVPQPWHDFPLLSELWLPSLVPCTSSYNSTAIIDVGSGNFRNTSCNMFLHFLLHSSAPDQVVEGFPGILSAVCLFSHSAHAPIYP